MFDKAKHTTRHDTAVTCTNNVLYECYKTCSNQAEKLRIADNFGYPNRWVAPTNSGRGVVAKHSQLRIADKWGRTN